MKTSNFKGFTISELLVSITILVLIMGVVYSTYILSQKSYREEENRTEILQNGRIILERMSREIRQTKEIVTVLPEERVNPPQEILFQDGHLSLVSETATSQGGSTNTITLASTSSNIDDYYTEMFIKIIDGTGEGQIRKIVDYDGSAKIAEIEGSWETVPNAGSTYKIDSSYYYIHYYRDATNNIWRRIIAYYCSGDPDTYLPWNTIPPFGQTLETQVLEESRLIGEYVTELDFWGVRVINIALTLEKQGREISLFTKVFGRNL